MPDSIIHNLRSAANYYPNDFTPGTVLGFNKDQFVRVADEVAIGSSGVRLRADTPRKHYNNYIAADLAAYGYLNLAEIAEAGHGCAFCHITKNYSTLREANAAIDLAYYNSVAVLLNEINIQLAVTSATVIIPAAASLELAATEPAVSSSITEAEAEATLFSKAHVTTITTTNASLGRLLQLAESGQVKWIAGDAMLFQAYQNAMAARRSSATGRAAFDLLRARLGSRVELAGPIHHWRFPITQFASEATSAEALYEIAGRAHLSLHLAMGIQGAPYRAMAWGTEREIQMMFNFWLP